MKLDPVLVTLAAFLFSVLVAIIGWALLAWRRTVTKTTEKVQTANILEQLEKDIAENDRKIEQIRVDAIKKEEEVQRQLKIHDGFFNAIQLRLNDFGHMEKTVQELSTNLREMNKKLDQRAKDTDQQFREQTNLLNAILLASKNANK